MIVDSDSSDVSVKDSTSNYRFLVSIHHRFDDLRQLFPAQGHAGPETPESLSFTSGTLNVQMWSKVHLESMALPKTLVCNILYWITG